MTERPRVVVVGLGPAGPELIDRATGDAIAEIPHRFVRTRRHPSAVVMQADPSFDSVYDAAATLDGVYATIVDALVDAATVHGEVLYAVPGSPLIAERSVEMLRDDPRIDAEIRPALSFLDLAWLQLGVDPVERGVRLVDGQRFAVEAAGTRGPLLVAQCDSRLVLSDIKLALDAGASPSLEPTAEVTVLQRLGTAEERVELVPWVDLDRTVEPDHLTTIWVPALASPIANELARFAELVATLRRECPWDREQTHTSLQRHLLEETYEVLDAIDHLDPQSASGYEHLEEELGDLLFQIVFHATLAAEAGQFTLADVASTVHDKLHRRHPHVFGDVEVDGADDVVRNWEQIKKDEKGRTSVFDGVPAQLPALLFALKLQKNAESVRRSQDAGEPLAPSAGLDDLASRARAAPDAEALGELLFAAVDLARRNDVDPESALRARAIRFRDSLQSVERAE